MRADDGAARVVLRGGVRTWRGNATWPLARLTASPDVLSVRAPLIGGLTVHRGQPHHLAPYQGVMSRGLRMTLLSNDSERPVTFLTGRLEELVRDLQRLGWVVHAGPTQPG